MNGIYTMASASSSSLYGNVGCAIQDLILSKFPYNYFNYTNVSTEVAFHNMRRQFGSNTNNEIAKRKRPYLIVQPTYQVPDADSFLQNVPLTKNDMDIQSNLDRRYLFEIIKDDKNGYNMKFKLNRDRIEFDVTVSVTTLHQQLDIYKAMMNQITWERSLYYTTALESVIPKTMIEYVSRLCKMDIYTTPELIPAFLKHLNTVSVYPITYKMRNASATDEFFMYYTHNLVVTFYDLNLESPNKKNMVDESHDVTFRVSAEFNLPGLYLLDGNIKKLDELRVALGTKHDYGSDNYDEYIPLFTISNFYNRYPQIRDGLTLYGSFIFHTDVKDKDEDSVDLTSVLDGDHQRAIRFHTKYGMVPKTICNIILLKNKEEVDSSQYRVDWSTFKVHFNRPDITATYRVIIYVNNESINAALANTRIDGPYDQHALKENTVDYSNLMGKGYTNADIKLTAEELENIEFTAIEKPEDLTINETPMPNIINGQNVDIDQVKMKHETIIAIPTDIPTSMSITGSLSDVSGVVSNTNVNVPMDLAYLNIPNEEQVEVIKKYSSSIFDDTSVIRVVAEDDTGKKSKYSSSKDQTQLKSKLVFRDNPHPLSIQSMDIWSKIISRAMIYNYATKIAIENDNNYSVNTTVE